MQHHSLRQQTSHSQVPESVELLPNVHRDPPFSHCKYRSAVTGRLSSHVVLTISTSRPWARPNSKRGAHTSRSFIIRCFIVSGVLPPRLLACSRPQFAFRTTTSQPRALDSRGNSKLSLMSVDQHCARKKSNRKQMGKEKLSRLFFFELLCLSAHQTKAREKQTGRRLKTLRQRG